jgi:SSS family solute:Na+ symporter
MIAGFFIKKISAMGAKVSLFVGLIFYITMTFIVKSELHFVHVWGIEFLLNVATMFLVSMYYPSNGKFKFTELEINDMVQWKHTKPMSIGLCVITISIYIMLGSF